MFQVEFDAFQWWQITSENFSLLDTVGSSFRNHSDRRLGFCSFLPEPRERPEVWLGGGSLDGRPDPRQDRGGVLGRPCSMRMRLDAPDEDAA
jgi:hypothetical protein